tara:strand:+ start:973 stop:1254 length:282 start_codon:yes stop_codon:yes gene_type:complete
VENEKNWEKDFNWFDQEHYQFDEMAARSREALLNAFHEITLKVYPNKMFGTVLKDIRQEGKEWKATVKRFKTKELCVKHCHFPSTYARTGVLL